MSIIRVLHDAWCFITGKCRISSPNPDEDEFIVHLKKEQLDSQVDRQRRRFQHTQTERKINRLEDLLIQAKQQHDGANH